jgi:hypothetical protein
MGVMKFLLPSGLGRDAVEHLARTSVTGGQDNMPSRAEVLIEPGQLTVIRPVDESGSLAAPWEVNGSGRVMASSATLMERSEPYHLLTELARGKLNQVRGQTADWIMGGLEMTAALGQQLQQATQAFVRAVVDSAPGQPPSGEPEAQAALAQGFRAADVLVHAYTDQVFILRHQRQARLETSLGCGLGSTVPDAAVADRLAETFNTVCLPLAWSEIERAEGDYNWETADAQVDWALARGLKVIGGPLIDFFGLNLPAWLARRKRDLNTLCSCLCDYVETAIARYRTRVHAWQVSAASNSAQVLAVGDEELLWLTLRLAEAARQIDPSVEIGLGIAQPWGEYLTRQDRTHSPFLFADTLVRSGLKLAFLDLEMIMAVSPRGSYCRDLLEVSRLLDLYALLGVPLQITLGYPSASEADANADPGLGLHLGQWRGPFGPETQADWASAYGALTLCKPTVRSVVWTNVTDAAPHIFPHCGLIDAQGKVKPALGRLRELRELHLK